MSHSNSTSSVLLSGIRNRNDDAWDQFVKLYSPLIYYWCQRRGVLSEEIDEVAQEVFLSIYDAIGRFDSDKKLGSFRGWIRQITFRRISDYFRRDNRCTGQAIGGSSAMQRMSQTPWEEFDVSDENRILIAKALAIIENEFSQKHQHAFRLLVLDHWKARDVAMELEMTINAVYMVRHHILKRLKSEFREFLD